jgi:hypothetical protein
MPSCVFPIENTVFEKRRRRRTQSFQHGDTEARSFTEVACGPPAFGGPDESGKTHECKWL